MQYLVFTNTPAHVHVYKHAVRELEARGHEVRILARDYQCTLPLLEYYDLPYRVYGRCGSTKYSLAAELPSQYASLVVQTLRYDPDVIFGMGAYAAHAGLVSRTPTVLVLDSEHYEFDHAISHPFAETLITPHAFRKDLGENHYRFRGFMECAYLHPEVYDSSSSVRDRLDIGRDEPLFVLRLNAFGSHHDVGASGFSRADRRRLVDRLTEWGTVVVSAEGSEPILSDADVRQYDLHPAHLHDVLAEARLVVTDTGTTTTEAALLGTPTIRSCSFVGDDDFGNFLELEEEGLLHNYRSVDDVVSRAVDIAREPSISAAWERRRREYVSELTCLADLIVDVAENGGDADDVAGLCSQMQGR